MEPRRLLQDCQFTETRFVDEKPLLLIPCPVRHVRTLS